MATATKKLTKKQVEQQKVLHLSALAAEFYNLDQQSKTLAKRLKVIKEEFKENGTFVDNMFQVLVSKSSRNSLDQDTLNKVYPDIVKLCQKEIEVTTVSVKKV